MLLHFYYSKKLFFIIQPDLSSFFPLLAGLLSFCVIYILCWVLLSSISPPERRRTHNVFQQTTCPFGIFFFIFALLFLCFLIFFLESDNNFFFFSIFDESVFFHPYKCVVCMWNQFESLWRNARKNDPEEVETRQRRSRRRQTQE